MGWEVLSEGGGIDMVIAGSYPEVLLQGPKPQPIIGTLKRADEIINGERQDARYCF